MGTNNYLFTRSKQLVHKHFAKALGYGVIDEKYALFESPEELMRRSKDGDTYYIIAAYDYHF